MKRVLSTSVLVACAAVAAARLPSQCASQAIAANALPGVLGTTIGGAVLTMVPWDPDGPGPLQRGIVVGGSLTNAGDSLVDGIAFLDLTTQQFSRLGTPSGNPGAAVARLATGPQGQLFALSGARVQRWSGSQWQPLSLQIDGAVAAMTILPNGEPVVGGLFSFIDGVPCAGLARHTAAGWSPLGFDFGTEVSTLATLANGDLLVGGNLIHPTGSGGLATVSGNTVSFVPGAPGGVFASVVAQNGDLYVAAGQPNVGIYRLSSGVWSSLTSQGSAGAALHVAPNGDLYVGGGFTVFEGLACNRIARFDGTTWSAVGAGVDIGFGPSVASIVDGANGGIVVGGNFWRAGNTGVANLANWDGTFWSPFGIGLNQPVRAVLPLPNGDLIVAGDFLDLPDANGARCRRIARHSNGQWFALGSGLDAGAIALARLPNGDLVVGGSFQTAGGLPCSNLARWDGTNWHAFGSGTNAYVHTLAVLPNGDLLAGGYFTTADGVAVGNAARWDGSQFHPFGSFNGGVEQFTVRTNGRVLAGGVFTMVDGQAATHVAEFTGTAWGPMGSGVPGFVGQILESPSGLVCASGGSGLFQWDGTQWLAQYGPLGVNRMCGLPDGSVLVTNAQGGPAQEAKVLRFDGSSVTPWASVLGGRIEALAVDGEDHIVCGGQFTRSSPNLGDVASPFLQRLATTCPSAQVPYGNGCQGSGGLVQLTAQSRPWLGSTWRARGTGMPIGAPFVLQLVGFPGWPTQLSWLLPEGQPGCDLLLDVVLLDVVVVNGGVADSQWPVPNVPALAGLSLAMQHLPFEFSSGTLSGVFASNALLATVGAY
ncbi:MAG: hypothetical protein JNK15_01350 [Planctomycetes bacterium]|nr:hypothetical protein [Planctomycetota bacterium]